MIKKSIRIPKLDIGFIEIEVKKERFEDLSDFTRQAIIYLLADLRRYPDITLERLEEIRK